MCSLTLSVGWAQTESRDIWFTWRNSLLLFLPAQQHDLILWLQLRRHIFLPMGDSLHGMELKAAGFKVQTQTIRVSADKELDRFRLSVSICHAQMSRWKGSGDNFKASLSIKIPNLISRQPYATLYSLEWSETLVKGGLFWHLIRPSDIFNIF